MTVYRTLLASATLAASAAVYSPPAQAAAPYQGIYVVMDPYNQPMVTELQTAAQTPCTANQQVATSPFCGATNGIMLRIAWCDFQLYHVKNPQNQQYSSCHYVVGFSGAAGSQGVQLPSTDLVSPCSGSFDICAGRTTSVLGTSLRYISQINTQRANAGLPPLKLSIGLYAGIGTPQGILDSVGYVDVPHTVSSSLDPSTYQCYRVPLSWKTQFLTYYEQATDQLLSYVQGQFPSGANIAILKLGGQTATDLEVEMPGQKTLINAPADPGPGGPGPALSCPNGKLPAQVWLDAYNANPILNQNLSQANESAFADILGHEYATLLNTGLASTLLSIATTNATGYPYVDCGVTGSSACSVKVNAGNYSVYYLEHYITDLWNGGLAYARAAAAYATVRADTFSLSPSQLAVNSTALSPTPIVASQQVSCALNNTAPARDPSMTLDSTLQQINGVGSVVGYQTQVNEGTECASSDYMTTLNNGIHQGGQFIEIETDAAFTNIAQCSPYLTNALNQITAISAAATCSY